MKKTEDCSHRTQSNPIHGWIQSMSNSAVKAKISIRFVYLSVALTDFVETVAFNCKFHTPKAASTVTNI